MKINGSERNDIAEGSIVQVLGQLKLQIERVVVEVNGTIVPKNKYETYQVDKSAIVEIVSFVGGG